MKPSIGASITKLRTPASGERSGILGAVSGVFTLTGNAANLVWARSALAAAVGAFTLTGNAATLTYSGSGGGGGSSGLQTDFSNVDAEAWVFW